MVNKPKAIGTAAERAVARYLQANGWPSAERRALRGREDAGDITGTPGVCWEVKSYKRPPSDGQISGWLTELATAKHRAHADVALLVVRRAGVGEGRAGEWWAYMTAGVLFDINVGRTTDGFARSFGGHEHAQFIDVRLRLDGAVRLLRLGGWGEPLEEGLDGDF